MRYAILGAGLIGSAAARHLSSGGHDVTLIGPDEPADWACHAGVFASHYDEGRITRQLDSIAFWAGVSRASILRYPDIASASGIDFFAEVGGMMAAPDLATAAEAGVAQGTSFQRIEHAGAASLGYHLPAHVEMLYEPARAGHISPRRLVAAQQAAATANGARRIRAVVQSAREDGTVVTDQGSFAFDTVLWAAGGFGAPHLRTLPLNVQGRTVVYFETPEPTAQAHAQRPTLILHDGEAVDIYLLPPIRYPNGRWYWKIGGGPHDRPLIGEAEMRAWFKSGGDPDAARALSQIFHDLVPDAHIVAESIAPCVTTYLPDELPAIGALSARVCVATAGNGRGAKCSDELGRLGADAVLGRCDPQLDPLRFAG